MKTPRSHAGRCRGAGGRTNGGGGEVPEGFHSVRRQLPPLLRPIDAPLQRTPALPKRTVPSSNTTTPLQPLRPAGLPARRGVRSKEGGLTGAIVGGGFRCRPAAWADLAIRARARWKIGIRGGRSCQGTPRAGVCPRNAPDWMPEGQAAVPGLLTSHTRRGTGHIENTRQRAMRDRQRRGRCCGRCGRRRGERRCARLGTRLNEAAADAVPRAPRLPIRSWCMRSGSGHHATATGAQTPVLGHKHRWTRGPALPRLSRHQRRGLQHRVQRIPPCLGIR